MHVAEICLLPTRVVKDMLQGFCFCLFRFGGSITSAELDRKPNQILWGKE